MDETGSDFDERDELLIEGLASWLTQEKAGELAGFTAKTVQRRLVNPRFAAAVAQRRRRRVDDLTSLLGDAAMEAISTLRESLGSESVRDRVSSARTLLDLLGRFHRGQILEHNFANRLAALEAQAAAARPSTPSSSTPQPDTGDEQ